VLSLYLFCKSNVFI
uniref:Uncharacterized protein n=1 Tax=Cebus imitator TaxID=2715852 RepID=A0A2K5QRM2_CEBIM